jgi:hypothetical protein
MHQVHLGAAATRAGARFGGYAPCAEPRQDERVSLAEALSSRSRIEKANDDH